MSASQQALDLVHAALKAMHDLGVSMQVPHAALARLLETAGSSGAMAAPSVRPAVASTPPVTTAPTTTTMAPAAGRIDMAAAFASHLAASTAAARPTPPRSEPPVSRETPVTPPTHPETPLPELKPASATPPAARPDPGPSRPSTSGESPSHIAEASSLAPRTGTKAERLAAMRGPVLACTKCPHLVRSRKQVVFGVGNPEAELMFVGEAPGADEDLVGEPFVGRAGQLLTKIIETMGLRRSDVYIANILKCRPDMPAGTPGNRKPEPDEMRTCKPYVLEQIEIIQPRVLVALGGTSVEGLLEIEKAGITRMRGQWREYQGIPLMPTFHPSYLLRPSADQQASKRLVWEDMLSVLEKLGRPITDKQRGFFLPKA